MNQSIKFIKVNRPDIYENIIWDIKTKHHIESGSSNNKVTYKCPNCQQTSQCWIYNLKKRKHIKCLKCTMKSKEMKTKLTNSSREYFSNPKSIKLTSEIIKKRWTDPQYRTLISKMKRDLWTDTVYRKKILKHISSHTKTRWQDSSFRQKMREVSSRLCMEGKLTKGIGTTLQTTKGGIIKTKSTFETRYIKLLEANQEVVNFIYEPFYIKYEYEGQEHSYIPDFLVCYKDRVELIEIKPEYFLNKEANPSKFEAAERHCVIQGCEFVIITENTLKTLESEIGTG